MINRIIILLLGIWLMVAPDILMMGTVAANNSHIIAPLIITFTIISMSDVTEQLLYLNLLLGGWLLIAPWILGYESNIGIISDSAIGLLVLVVTGYAKGIQEQPYGGGWKSLFK